MEPGDVYVTAPRSQIKDLDSLPLPDRSMVDYEKYNRYIGQAFVKNKISLLTSRGCPYKCLYCHKIWPNTHVFRTAENIFSEVCLYYNMGIKNFSIVDDIFNLNKKNSERFFRLIIENRLDVRFFFPNGVRADILSKDYIDLMIEAGTTVVAFALETASPRLQKLIGKNLDLERFKQNIEYMCKKYPEVGLDLFMMVGFPTETEAEAMTTLNFLKSLQWVHYPSISILKIYPNTGMEKLALENGISREAIKKSVNLAYYEVPETMPFSKSFMFSYQAEFLHKYFLLKQRLLHVLPYQMKILTEDEFVEKYNSYLPTEINGFNGFLELTGITPEQLAAADFVPHDSSLVPDLNEKIRAVFPAKLPDQDAVKILLIDLSQFFTGTKKILYDVVEPPLGLIALLSYLVRHMGTQVNSKIIKSRIDFDNYAELKELLYKFNPDIIGLRTLTFFKAFFHETAALIREWGIVAPIIAGGPYATSDYKEVLDDRNIDLVVLGEGEITFYRLIREYLENGRQLPNHDRLRKIPGISFIPGNAGKTGKRNFLPQEEVNNNKVKLPGLFSYFNEELENE